MSNQKNVLLNQFKSSCNVFGPSSYISLRGIHLVSEETGGVCASYLVGKVIVGDKVYVRIPEEYGTPE